MAYMDMKPEEKQEILETIDVAARMDKVSQLLAHRIEVLRLSAEIGQQTKASLDERQREVLLREQMAAIQKQLGEGEEGKAAELAELEKTIAEAGMPEEVEEHVRKELRRLQRMPEAAAEYGMARTYLDWLIELPWKLPEETPIDIVEARRILDEDHYGLDKIKRRIVEYLAVRKLAPAGQGADPVLRRPAGRRQDLARPVDRARHEPQVRAREPRRRARRGRNPRPPAHLYRRAARQHHPGHPQGGNSQLRDDAGRDRQARRRHPRRSVRRRCWRCSIRSRTTPSAITISGCRSTCRRVVFITTANMLDTIPGPLRDRMEIISLAGYTDGEKLQIAARYLVKRQMEANGIKEGQVEITEAALREIIHYYTREAGVRNLEREIGKVLRHAAVRIAEGTAGPIRIDAGDLAAILGAPPVRERSSPCAPACPASRPGSPGRRSAATSSSSRRPACPATAS